MTYHTGDTYLRIERMMLMKYTIVVSKQRDKADHAVHTYIDGGMSGGIKEMVLEEAKQMAEEHPDWLIQVFEMPIWTYDPDK
jgi:hypothetical protein